MNILFQLDIPRRSPHCAKGGEKLIPGMEIYSLLVEDENQLMVRQDFCLDCWQQAISTENSSRSHGYWKSRIEPKKEPAGPQSRTLRALVLLKSLLQDPGPHEAEIFVLALYLAHARQLILRQDIEREGHSYALYEVAHQDEFITIKKVDLSLIETKHIQASLASRLQITQS